MSMLLDRRQFASAGLGAVAALAVPPKSVKFGIVADLHHGLMPDAHHRLEAFMAEAERQKPDFIIQLGDFCHPKPESRGFLRTWHSFRGPKHNVLGNHDMDHGTKPQIMELVQMPKNYYSFDTGGFHFVVLDCNHIQTDDGFIDFANGNYFGKGARRDWVNTEQVQWLLADLRSTALPSVIFTHQGVGPFWAKDATVNRANIRAALAEVNQTAGWQKVIGCFSGHHHVDHHALTDSVNYFLVNSASYYWVGEAFGSLAKYRDPLFTFVTLDPAGSISLTGKNSQFIPPNPTELRHPDALFVTASIQERRVSFRPQTR